MLTLLRPCCCLLVLLSSFCASQETSQPQAPQQEASPTNAPQQNKPEMEKIVGTLAQIKNLPAEWAIGPYIPASGPLVPLTAKQRANVYFKQTYFSVGPYVLHLFTAGIDQARNYPSEWGGGMAAFGDRFGNRYGRFVIANTLTAAGNAAAGYEPRYDVCRCTGFWARSGHAVLRNFVNYNHTETQLRPAFFLYGGAFASGAVSVAWLPGRRSVWREGGVAMLSQAGWGSAYNWVSEFAVDILHKITKRDYNKRLQQE